MIRRGLLRERPSAVLMAKRLADLALTLLCGVLVHRLLSGQWLMDGATRELLLYTLLGGVLLFDLSGLYRSSTRGGRLLRELEMLLMSWGALFMGYLVVNWLTGLEAHLPYPWWMPLTAATSFLSQLVFRDLSARALGSLRARGFNRKRIAIAVASDLGRRVSAQIKAQPGLGIDVVGYIDDRGLERLSSSLDAPVLGTVDHIARLAQQHDLDQVWLAMPFRAEERIRHILHELRHSTVDIQLVPDVFQFFLMNQALDEIGGIPVHTLTATPMQGINRWLKAIEDRLLSALILILISPLLLLIAAAVKASSPGPVIFKQKRHGWNGRAIEVWKFRTMRLHDASHGIKLATRHDPRVTRVGAFLRRTSLDELPQFFNVLRGDMSIVGPRPHPIEINDAYKDSVDKYMLRHKVKPGITGWAQVNGLRGELDTPDKMERRVQHDLYYIEHWSLWFDLRIVLMTFFKGFVHENAY